MDVSSVSLSLGNLAAAQTMSAATAQAAADTSTDAASGTGAGASAGGAAGVAIDVLAMELRAQRSLVDLFA